MCEKSMRMCCRLFSLLVSAAFSHLVLAECNTDTTSVSLSVCLILNPSIFIKYAYMYAQPQRQICAAHIIQMTHCDFYTRRKLLTNDKSLAGVSFSVCMAVYSWHCILFRNPHVGSLLNVNQAGLEAEAVGGLLIYKHPPNGRAALLLPKPDV